MKKVEGKKKIQIDQSSSFFYKKHDTFKGTHTLTRKIRFYFKHKTNERWSDTIRASFVFIARLVWIVF
jgi:hypothetical protein